MLDNYFALQTIRMVLFVGFFSLATTVLIPKGILSFIQWKEHKKFTNLTMSINCFVGGIFLLAYLLARFIDFNR
jgi:integral membrane sensor domain MASE1